MKVFSLWRDLPWGKAKELRGKSSGEELLRTDLSPYSTGGRKVGNEGGKLSLRRKGVWGDVFVIVISYCNAIF